MSIKARKKILLAKLESTYGVDASPTGAANAILTSNFVLRPLEAGTVERNLDRPTLGSDPAIHVGVHVGCEFDVEIAGSGAADQPPTYGPLLRACGLAETVTPTTGPVEYDPVSAGFESLTNHFHHDGQKHAFVGARGDLALRFNPRELPHYHVTLLGLWVDPQSVADPTPDWSGFQDPLAVSNANTPTFSLHGAGYTLVSLELSLSNVVNHRDLPGEESVQIVDRAVGGRVVIEAPALSTKNWFTTAKANTLGALQIVHGTAAGHTVQVDAAQVQVLNPRYGELDGIATLEMDLRIVPSDAGDDELTLTVK